MIEKDKMSKIESEIRVIVDETIRGELELLQAAYDKDRAFKGKKSKKQQKKAIIFCKLLYTFHFVIIIIFYRNSNLYRLLHASL